MQSVNLISDARFSDDKPNVLHAVSDVRAALRNLHGLLAPGGSLIFMDTATPQLWTETVFGLTSGWWRFTDRDLRPEHPQFVPSC